MGPPLDLTSSSPPPRSRLGLPALPMRDVHRRAREEASALLVPGAVSAARAGLRRGASDSRRAANERVGTSHETHAAEGLSQLDRKVLDAIALANQLDVVIYEAARQEFELALKPLEAPRRLADEEIRAAVELLRQSRIEWEARSDSYWSSMAWSIVPVLGVVSVVAIGTLAGVDRLFRPRERRGRMGKG